MTQDYGQDISKIVEWASLELRARNDEVLAAIEARNLGCPHKDAVLLHHDFFRFSLRMQIGTIKRWESDPNPGEPEIIAELISLLLSLEREGVEASNVLADGDIPASWVKP